MAAFVSPGDLSVDIQDAYQSAYGIRREERFRLSSGTTLWELKSR